MKEKSKEKTEKPEKKKKDKKAEKLLDKKSEKKNKKEKKQKDPGTGKDGNKKKEKKDRKEERELLTGNQMIQSGDQEQENDQNLQPEDSAQGKGAEIQALIFKALGDENRLQILELLQEQELCAAELLQQVPIVQSTLSHHMKILCESGLVICRRQARWMYYTVNKQLLAETSDWLKRRSK